MMLVLAIIGLLSLSTDAYKTYQDSLPNGDMVPNPCIANHLWQGVGHKNILGGGDRNPFGIAFKLNEVTWDPDFCNQDSDNDGRTNGQELGDPDCVWKPGQAPTTSVGLTHPGICEPLDDEQCKEQNNWLVCDETSLEFKCDGTKSADVVNVTVHLDRHQVPNTETNYYCQLVQLPHDIDYHVVAVQPMLDNEQVIHHMILFGCLTDEGLEDFRTPGPCGMQVDGLCPRQLAGWTVGQSGDCLDGIDAGIRMGKSSSRYGMLQVHWNNPELKDSYMDGSGLILHYTHILRTYNLGTLTVGQMALGLLPGLQEVKETSVCEGSCTETFIPPGGVQVISTGVHMHYAGRGAVVDVYRDGQLARNLVNEERFSYDNPLDYNQDPPFALMPGDEIRLTCSFKTTNRPDIVYYGDGTSEEMCFAFISYFPEITDKRDSCISFGDATMCAWDADRNFTHIGDCPFEGNDELFGKMASSCDITGNECTESCKRFFIETSHPCLERGPKMFFEFFMPKFSPDLAFLTRASRSCDNYLYRLDDDEPPVDGAPGLAIAPIGLALSLATCFFLKLV